MQFLYNNAVAIAVAAVCSVFAWLYGGTVTSALLPTVPWVLAILFELMICFPQRHRGESTTQARTRVWKRLKRDPLTWVVLAFLLVLIVPFFNKGLCPCCDYPEIHFDGMRQAPPIPFLPYCVNRAEHFTVLLWFVPALTAMLAVRHALLSEGKRTLLALIVWNGVALSALGIVQHICGAESPLWAEGWGEKAYFFSTFGYPNMGGDYFTTLFALAVALWRWRLDEIRAECSSDDGASKVNCARFWRKHLYLIPAVVFFLSAMMTLSRAAIVLVSFLAVLFFIHSFISLLANMSRLKRVKAIGVNLIAIVIVATFFYGFFFNRDTMMNAGGFRNEFNEEVSTLSIDAMLDRAAGKGQYHVRVATAIWLDNIFFGCGGWGYKHFCVPEMTDEEFLQMQKVGGINVHNDFLQFLAEHGLVGFGLMVAMVIMLLSPIVRTWRKLVTAAAFSKGAKRPPRPIAIFALPASTFCILAALAATLLHSLADCPLRSPAVLALFFVALAAAEGFMPKLKTNDE